MAKYLVIVESPTKVKTIKKFLGSNYEVAASNGHVRDLPKSQMGIDVEHDFEPSISQSEGRERSWLRCERRLKRRTKSFWQQTRTGRERPFPGTFLLH